MSEHNDQPDIDLLNEKSILIYLLNEKSILIYGKNFCDLNKSRQSYVIWLMEND